MLSLQQIWKTLSAIFLLIGIFYLASLIYNRYIRTEAVIDKKIEKVSNEKKKIQSEIKLNHFKIDSLKKANSKSDLIQSKEIKKYYTDKEKSEKKIKEDEKNINASSPSSDSIYLYLSNYKFSNSY